MRGLPGVERERPTGREIETVLATLRPEPEAILAAVVVELRPGLSRFDEAPVDPAKARRGASDRARHHAPLVLRRQRDLRSPFAAQDDHAAMGTEEGDVVIERSG